MDLGFFLITIVKYMFQRIVYYQKNNSVHLKNNNIFSIVL